MVVLGQVEIEISPLPVAVRVSKTRVFKLPILSSAPRTFGQDCGSGLTV